MKRYHKASLELGALNHLQALKGLKEEVKIARSWYNSRAPMINEVDNQVKIDIWIKEEKVARVKGEQLEELRR